MAEQQQQQQYAPGGHYSGHNPIPTVKQFVENLDRDKKTRDKQLDQAAAQEKQQQKLAKSGKADVQPHETIERQVKGTEKTVTDPTTGNQVVIADVSKEMMKEVDDPHLVIPNANLNKDTVGRVWNKRRSMLTLIAHQNRPVTVIERVQVQSRRDSSA